MLYFYADEQIRIQEENLRLVTKLAEIKKKRSKKMKKKKNSSTKSLSVKH